MADAPLYTLTDADRELIARARVAFGLDYRYLLDVIVAARKRLD